MVPMVFNPDRLLQLAVFYALIDRVKSEGLAPGREAELLSQLERYCEHNERIVDPPRFMIERFAFLMQSLGMTYVEHDALKKRVFR